VWQVRANGTHRIFPFYNPEWVRRTIGCMKIGTASGYTVEGLDAYFPKRPEYYLADPSKKAYDWIVQRDFMYWSTWGRLGYDPTVPDSTFDKQAVRMLGRGTIGLVDAWKNASVLVPLAFMAYSLGPDHRSHAPELEWGGVTSAYIQGQGFDTHAFTPVNEQLALAHTRATDGRTGLAQLALRGLQVSEFDEAALSEGFEDLSAFAQEVASMVALMHARARYSQHRFRLAQESASLEAAEAGLRKNAEVTAQAMGATDQHTVLSSKGLLKPFTDRLRMRTNTFAWTQEQTKVEAELERILALPLTERVLPLATRRGPSRGKVAWSGEDGLVACTFTATDADRAWLLVKPLPSSTYFHRVPMKREGERFVASFKRERWGHMVAVEAAKGDSAARFPDVAKETPYLIVPSQSGPTPQIYSAEEAMTYLEPEVITPEKHGAMIIGTRGWRFFSSFDRATRRKLLDPVARGMKLLILQQDFNRYNLDFLPRPLRFESGNWTTFDPAGQLGLEKTETADVMWQRFLPSEGWDVFGNGGLARLKHGKGEVWVCSARLMQRMHIPSAARNFVALLGIGGREKPTILIDSNSEGADFSSSNHPDLMNSHDVPFLTLGEVIALEQGMDSFTPVPGPVGNDDVLGGKGKDLANAWLKAQVVRAAKRASPGSLAEFGQERKRRKGELMRSLGLDPMPERTPLNPRTTGTLLRRGYRIEKVVFESRPGFFVTAHVFSPYPPATKRVPVIVHVNGHWAHKKAEDRLQLRAAFSAIRGYVAIAIDSPGWSFEGNSLIERRAEGNHNDWWLVQGGSNATGYYVWDVMRAMDYLATRSDTDMKNVGITGASGGGLATLYAFAADDRFKAAVPVVYMASMELAPDNGCLCNHVPGTMQVGDRSDVLAIQAPKPVYIFGAEVDPEFPADATKLTVEKCKREWSLFGKADDVNGMIFAGGHDYNQAMRETMIGFFDKHLRGVGTGAPVGQPPIDVIDPEDRTLLVLDPPPTSERTMRDLTLEYLKAAAEAKERPPVELVFELNGGRAPSGDLRWIESGKINGVVVEFDGEPGLRVPGVLFRPVGAAGAQIIVSDAGKAAEIAARPPSGDRVQFYVDILGTGELGGIELRYPVYLGRSVAFIGGATIARAASELKRHGPVEVVARGPLSTLAATYAGLLDPSLKIKGADALPTWADYLSDGVPAVAVQPRAHLLPTLEELRKRLTGSTWEFRPGT
jgi:dienelactone hydrolase